MRQIDTIVIHCSATGADRPLPAAELDWMHRQRGFDGCGYHYYIRRDGFIHSMRPKEKIGAHVRGHNATSIGICYEGGLDENGQPADTRTDRQKYSMRSLVKILRQEFPEIRLVCGHRDLSPDRDGNGVVTPDEWLKQCPCFDVGTDL